MIIVNLIDNNGILVPERVLSLIEQSTITSTLFDGVNAIYYQGDEPTQEVNEIVTE